MLRFRDLRGGAVIRPPVGAKVARTPVGARVKEPKSGLEVRQQPMWHNRSVHVQGESLSFKEEIEKKQFAFIDDFVDNKGNMLTYDKFQRRCGSRSLNALLLYKIVFCYSK